uniref:RRM domain-containing protein n=1 Tax=Bionectria ochroleuca TaxID=29856 RepID=A0A8H7NE86_BIOOC
MAQPPQDLSYLDYGAPPNRSPGSRPSYTGAFGGGLSLPRQTQRPFDPPMGSTGLYPSDRHGGYHPRGIDNMNNGGGMPSYLLDNNHQHWSQGGSGVATVNGAVNGPSRQRSVGRRAALPQNWTDHGGMGLSSNMQGFPSGLNGLGNGGLRVEHPGTHASPSDLRSTASDGDQLIPTAIVIKNIPFAVRKETLASIMLELHLPQPYAFNYHFDNGVFRGLAFANFQSAEDTRIVIEAMNGMDVHGRKLRVEYKKMLPEAERERIEREKRERRGQLEEQHRAPLLHQQSSIQSLGSMAQAQARGTPSHSVDAGDIDLNDPQTLEFYTELAMFKRDESREILIFPAGIAPEHRPYGAEATAFPKANNAPAPSSSLDMHKRGLSRAATFDFAADRESRGGNSNLTHVMGRQGPTLELPGSPDGNAIPNNLRAAKSFADLRSFTPSPSQASSSYLAPGGGMGGQSAARYGDYISSHPGSSGTPGPKDNGLISGLSNLSLGAFDPNTLQTQSRSTPGAIGSQRPGANGNSKGAPERQPRGPEWETSTGFGGRGRSNGHVPRGSDSSDNGARVATSSSGVSRFH